MSLEKPIETGFSLFTHSYSIPEDEALYIPVVVKADTLDSLQSLDRRLQLHEENFLRDKQTLLEELAQNHAKQGAELAEAFNVALAAEVDSLRKEVDVYFSTITRRSADLCLAALKRLHIDISSEDKVRALVGELAATYGDQRDVELHIPEDCDFPLKGLDLPSDWKIVKDEPATNSLCRLVLGFGEVMGDFDKSFNIILSMIADKQ